MPKPEIWIGPAQFTVGVVKHDDYEARLQSHLAGKSKEDKTKHEEDLVWVLARELTHCFERSRWRHKGKELLPRYGGGK